MKLWPWAVVTAMCATTSTVIALQLHRDHGDGVCATAIVAVPIQPPLVHDMLVPAPPVVERVRELAFDASAYPEIDIVGALVRGVRWHDAKGDNVVVFSDVRTVTASTPDMATETSVLHAAHYIVSGASMRHVRTIKQRTECQDGDMISAFAAGYRVTDLDEDGLGELMFGVFHGACPTDVSPGQFKLFLVEDGAKYVLRGTGHHGDVQFVPPAESRSLDGAPAVFVKQLDTYWSWLSDQWKSHLPL